MSKNLVVCAIVFLTATVVRGQDADKLIELADSLSKVGDYEQSSKRYEEYYNSARQEITARQLYNAAVSFSKSNNAEKATFYLQEAIEKGVDDEYLTEIRFDLNFQPIYHTNEWRDFFEANTQEFREEAKHISHPQIRQELLQLWQSDQYYRHLIFGRFNGRPPKEVANAIEAVDRYNAMRLEQIVDQIGWPSHGKAGRDGAHAAWNIIQHAVFNPPLMKRCLEKMEVALQTNEVDGIDYAYLYDRFNAVCYLGKQDYGIVRRVPIRDEYLVEQRRKERGFSISLEEYLGSYTPVSKEEYEQREQEMKNRYETNRAKGNVELAKQNYEEALTHYLVLMNCNGYIKTEDIYSMARIQAKLNTRRSKFQAIRYLRSLSARGFGDIERLETDEAFDELRTDKAYEEVIQIIRKYNTTHNAD